jgi:uncharacterized membrane protein
MLTTLPASQMTYIATVVALVTGIMTGVAALIGRIPVMQQDAALFTWTVRAINLLLSLGGVLAAEATLGTFDLHNWVAYVLAAVGSAGAAHFLYTATTARSKSQLASAHIMISNLSNLSMASQRAATSNPAVVTGGVIATYHPAMPTPFDPASVPADPAPPSVGDIPTL